MLVASIPHSGTMFTLDLLPLRTQSPMEEPEKHTKRYLHIGEHRLECLMAQCFTIVPMRHPREVARSWHRRGMSVRELPALWRRLMSIRNAFFFPIDSPCRDEYLFNLSAALNMKLKTDWRAKNQFAGPSSDIEYPITNELSAFVGRFW